MKQGAVIWRMASDTTVDFVTETQVVKDMLRGGYTRVVTNRYLDISGTPLYNDATNTTALFFPYISIAATKIGFQIYGATDTSLQIIGNTGLSILAAAVAVTQMPALNLGADKPVYGPMKWKGINATGTDPSSASSFYTVATNTSFTPGAIAGTSTLARQKWSAVWGAVGAWAAFQSYDGFMISHGLELSWRKDNGQDIGAKLIGYIPSCRCTPAGPITTLGNALTEMPFSGPNSAATVTAGQGQTTDLNISDLVLSGAVAGTITLKNMNLKSVQTVFAGDKEHNGPHVFEGNIEDSSGTPSAGIVFSGF